MPHKHVNRCCWFSAQILLPEDWSLMLTATLFCIELPPGPLSHHFPKPLTSGRWPVPCLYSTVAAPDLPMDQAKAISRGDHILVQISYSALFCFSYSFIKKSHSQETLPHTLLLGNHPKRTWFQAIYSATYLVLRASHGDSCLLKMGPGLWRHAAVPWDLHRGSLVLAGSLSLTHTASRLGSVTGSQDRWAHHSWMSTGGRVAGPPVLHIVSYLLALFKLWMRLFTFLKSTAETYSLVYLKFCK